MQEEFIGHKSIEKLSSIIDKYAPERVLMFTGGKSYELSDAREDIEGILEIPCERFASITPNPNLGDIEQGIQRYTEADPDLVIGVGGGSVIDTAKSVNILTHNEHSPEEYIKGEKKLLESGSPLIAIPTTAGTGSEATPFSTIYIDKEKYSLSSPLMLPDVAIVNFSFTYSMPPYLTAYTGLDALCQGIESLWSINSTIKSREYARKAIKLAFKHIEQAVKNPEKKSRAAMAKAANLAGKAIGISKTTACHSISYPITAHFDIPHGHAVALTMPLFLEFNYEINETNCNDARGPEFVKERMSELFSLLKSPDGSTARETFENLLIKVNVESKLHELSIRGNLELILEEGFTPNRMNNNPKKVDKDDLKNILSSISR